MCFARHDSGRRQQQGSEHFKTDHHERLGVDRVKLSTQR